MGNQNTRNNLGLGDDGAVMVSFKVTRGQRRRLGAMARAAGIDRSGYIRRQLGLSEGQAPFPIPSPTAEPTTSTPTP
jgi:hypothetical protein